MAFTGILARLLRTAELARLQEIKQLGAGYLFHPYAFHTRFHHSLGVSWRVRFFIDSLPDKEFRNLSMKDKLALTIAGLLHDIGQSAWSHVGEQFAKFQGEYLSHEKRAADLILDDKGEFDTFFKPWVHLPRIREILPSRPLREKVAALIQGRPPISDVELPESQETTKENIRREKAWMAPLIRGPFDMDRADFLTRDAHFTLMATQMLIDPANMAQKVGIFRRDPPGISELVFLDCPFAESFITGRELMYHGVYLESRKLVADQVLIRAFHKLRNSLNSSVDSFWLSTDQRIFAYFEQSEDPFVALVRELMLCRKTFDIIYDVHFTELGPEERDNLIALDTRKERLLDAEEIIHQRCKAQGCSFDRDDFLLAIAPWSKPDIGKAWVKVGKELKRLDDVSPLLDALTSDRYIASRSKFIIAVNPIINMSDSDRNNLVRTARAFLSEDLNKLFLSTK
jgi:HD superfamily phosphohydrolase